MPCYCITPLRDSRLEAVVCRLSADTTSPSQRFRPDKAARLGSAARSRSCDVLWLSLIKCFVAWITKRVVWRCWQARGVRAGQEASTAHDVISTKSRYAVIVQIAKRRLSSWPEVCCFHAENLIKLEDTNFQQNVCIILRLTLYREIPPHRNAFRAPPGCSSREYLLLLSVCQRRFSWTEDAHLTIGSYVRSLVCVAIVRRCCSASYHRTHHNSPMLTSKRRLSSHTHTRGSSHAFVQFGDPEIVRIQYYVTGFGCLPNTRPIAASPKPGIRRIPKIS